MFVFANELACGFFGEMANFLCNDDLCDYFSSGAFGDVEMPYTLFVGVQFVAFGNIGRDGNCRRLHLVL